MYKGNLVSFQPRTKKFVSLRFHRGADIPGDHARLEGDAAQVRTMYFDDVADVEAHQRDLEGVVPLVRFQRRFWGRRARASGRNAGLHELVD